MKKILNEKGHLIARCIVFQIAMSIFGIMINSVTVQMSNTILLLGGIFSVLFYFSIMGAFLNEDGLKDKIKKERNSDTYDYFYGMKYVSISYIPSLLITIIHSVLTTFGLAETVTSLLNMLIRFFISGMYIGIDVYLFSSGNSVDTIAYNSFSSNGYSFIIYQLFSVIICGLFYYMGMKGINLIKSKRDNK